MDSLQDQNASQLQQKRELLIKRYKQIRNFSMTLCEPLEIEDFVIQSMPDVSPSKWHLAHTTWFFETFILCEYISGFERYNDTYAYLFNSYYVQAGERWHRPSRGLLARPTVKQVFEYRTYVDEKMLAFLRNCTDEVFKLVYTFVDIGLHHEQQHQELFLTDIKHVFSLNPLFPVYEKREIEIKNNIDDLGWVQFSEGIFEIGHNQDTFFYDNEKPQHKVYLNSYKLSSRLVTNKEYIEFIEDGGYITPTLWLSEGIAAVEREKWDAPLYWKKIDDEWWNFTLSGFRKVNPAEPVCHISFYEAEAFARWAEGRLPTEAEWEHASKNFPIKGNFVENNQFHPVPFEGSHQPLNQMFGDVWEWTSSDYAAYPGYRTPEGAIGEYNGKFMSNQIVLRGGSCATSETQIRKTYRNFFYHHQRWQFMGLRLAKNK